jgi:hypothetical protein
LLLSLFSRFHLIFVDTIADIVALVIINVIIVLIAITNVFIVAVILVIVTFVVYFDVVAAVAVTVVIKTNSVALVRKRTIPTERPPHVSEISANFSG